MRQLFALISIFTTSSMLVLGQGTPLSQRQACSKFSDAVVMVSAGGNSFGSGFLVSPDGFILTASHVVRDEQGQYYAAIFVTLSDGSIQPASPGASISLDSVGEDFALLKINVKKELPFLALGSAQEVVAGGDATIIGFPFSALSATGTNVTKKFCLTATFAASDLATVTETGTSRTRAGNIPVQKDVKVDVIYFQGPSVKGISGSPIISRDTGNVVGIVSTKLTGIGAGLKQLEDQTGVDTGMQVLVVGMDPRAAVHQILAVLDQQLANGLGSAVGIDDPKEALKQAQRRKR